jgi:hypothetical protein
LNGKEAIVKLGHDIHDETAGLFSGFAFPSSHLWLP